MLRKNLYFSQNIEKNTFFPNEYIFGHQNGRFFFSQIVPMMEWKQIECAFKKVVKCI